MKAKPFLAVIIFNLQFSVFNAVFSQTFQRTYGTTGSQTATCIQLTPDGSYIVSAIAAGVGAGNNDFLLMKISTTGALLWAKTYGGSQNENPFYVSVCSDDGFIITGYTYSFGTGGMDLYLVRTDSDGNLQWSKTLGGAQDDVGWFVMETNDGGFVTSGHTNSFGGFTWKGYLTKHDSNGNLMWTKVFNSSGDVFYGMAETSDGGYIITGSTGTNSFGSSDIWLVKTDSNGDTLWTAQYGRITEDAGWAVIQTLDGGYAITGDMHRDTITPGAHNTVLLKTDSQGNMQWTKLFGSNPGAEVGYDLLQMPDSGYLVLGNSDFYGAGAEDILLVRADASGNLKWAKTFGDTLKDDGWQIRKTNNGYVIAAATENFSANGMWDAYILSLDSAFADSCNSISVPVQEDIPFVQQKRGAVITTGGTSGNPGTIVNTVTLGIFDPCFVVSVANLTENESFLTVYPNPSFGKFSFSSAGMKITDLKIYNLLGEIVRAHALQQPLPYVEIKLDIPSGIYLYQLQFDTGILKSGKIVVH